MSSYVIVTDKATASIFRKGMEEEGIFKILISNRLVKLFIGKPCKKRADDMLKLSRHLLRLTFAIFTGHAPVRGQLYTMGLSDWDPTCRFCRKESETMQHIICCCETLACQRYSVFGNLIVAPKGISTASIKDLCLYIKGAGLSNLR
jgi:hypothetical protein